MHPSELDNTGSCLAEDPLLWASTFTMTAKVSVSIIQGYVLTGAHEKIVLDAVLNDHSDSVKCITDSDRGYYSSAIKGFTIGVTLKPSESEHLDLLIKAKEDEDDIAEQKQKLKGTC